MAGERPGPAATRQKRCLPISESAIESLERPMVPPMHRDRGRPKVILEIPASGSPWTRGIRGLPSRGKERIGETCWLLAVSCGRFSARRSCRACVYRLEAASGKGMGSELVRAHPAVSRSRCTSGSGPARRSGRTPELPYPSIRQGYSIACQARRQGPCSATAAS